MVITFFAPAQKTGRASKTPGSVLDRHYALKWVSFRSAATRLGYSHVNHFISAFKRKFGYSPGSLRRK
jgi:AraC-like DNA-binding protein